MGASEVILRDREVLDTGRIVNAGVSAGLLTSNLPIRKRKGHLVELSYLKSAHSVTSGSVAFNLQPRRAGQLLLGSSCQFDVESTFVDAKIVRAMHERARRYVPQLGTLSGLQAWAGFHAATLDQLSLIGPIQQDESIFLAAGHEGLGITASLATAHPVADCCLGLTPAIPLEPYLPSCLVAEEAHA